MALQKKLTGAAFALGLTLAFSMAVSAQQTQPPAQGDGAQQQQEMGRRKGRRMGEGGPRGRGIGEGFGVARSLRELNLSEAQQQQARNIIERFVAAIKPQREQLMQLREQSREGNAPPDIEERAKALRAQIHESEKTMRTEMLAILTAEQRTKLEQIETERKARRNEMRQRRRGAQPDDVQ